MARVQQITAESTRRALFESNVFARVRRQALRRHGILLRKTRPGSRKHQELGTYYAVNYESGFVEASHVRLEDVALELEVIRPGQQIVPG
jgi:hypothetical protein